MTISADLLQLKSLVGFAACALTASLVLVPSTSVAVYPETGMYVDDSEGNRGRGYYVEIQNETLFLVIYAYDKDTGDAEIYTAAGQVRDDAIEAGLISPVAPPPNPEGYFPLHWMVGKLYRVTDGPCLICDLPESNFSTEEIGDVGIFFPYVGKMQISIVPYEVDPDNPVREASAVKQNFKLGSNNVPGFFEGTTNVLMPDIMGQWIFVDQSDPERAPWRFNFDQRIPEPDDGRNLRIVEIPFEVTYRDSSSGAELRCDIRIGAEGQKLSGCELHQSGEVLFSANRFDLGPSRIRAFLGELPVIQNDPPLPTPEFWRGPDAVIGVRIETPPDLDGEP